jgi:protein-glutamine gamma-glutamyltransferase
MLKTDWKQNLILLVFSFIMIDVLTMSTLLFVIGGMVLMALNFKTNKLVRNIIAVGVFASYWITYGKIIDPEVGLNFLVSIIVLKILERETVRDRYMIFFGLILLISAGSLFERTLTYVCFFSISFLILLRDFYSYLGQSFRLKDLGLALLWVLPLTFFLFFFVPRLLNPIPFQQGGTGKGEIGYTPEVNVSQIDSLASNDSPVFQAILSKPVNQGELYWRANTLSYNDGWNWVPMVQDYEQPELLLGAGPSTLEIKQNIRLYTRGDYFFVLDVPRVISYNDDILSLGPMRTLSQRRYNWVQKYEVISRPRLSIEEEVAGKHYLQVPLNKNIREKINNEFPGKTMSEVVKSIRTHFLKEQFSYSLSPGRSASFSEFLERKVGLCSHYASATAIILRLKGIPSRLVSGFMGGVYNQFASFYVVGQNDAHVWVEAFDNGRWIRLDPTEWIAPDRVRLGGEAFLESSAKGVRGKSMFKLPGVFQDMKKWFAQWDFHFYNWLEQMDYHTQEAWLSRLNFKRQYLFSVIPLVMVVFMLAYSWFLATRKRREDQSEWQEIWQFFMKKMKKKGIILSNLTVYESDEMIKKTGNQGLLMVWNDLVKGSFGNTEISKSELRKKIKNL